MFAFHRFCKPSPAPFLFLLVMAVCVITLSFPTTSIAAIHPGRSSNAVEVTFETVNVSVEQEFEVVLNISDVTGLDITAFNLVVLYDASLVTATAATLEGTLSGPGGANMTLVYNASEDGRIAVAVAGVDALAGAGNLIVFTFQSTGLSGDVALSFENITFNEGDPIAEGGTGVITIEPPLAGDTSLNGEVTAFDAAAVLQHAIYIDTLSTAGSIAADVSADNDVSAYDAALILQRVSGLIGCFPSEEGCASKHGGSAYADISWGEARADGMLVHLPLLLENIEGDVHAFTMEIDSGNGSDIDYELETNLPGDWIVFHSKNDAGRINITMAGLTPLSSDTLLVLTSKEFSSFVRASTRINEEKRSELADVDPKETPSSFMLEQNYPNPFNPTTSIAYALEEEVDVSLIVYDMLGREVKRLVDGRQRAGAYTVGFDATSLSSGIYIYRLETTNFSQTRQMTLVK